MSLTVQGLKITDGGVPSSIFGLDDGRIPPHLPSSEPNVEEPPSISSIFNLRSSAPKIREPSFPHFQCSNPHVDRCSPMTIFYSQFFTCSNPHVDRFSKPLPWNPLCSPLIVVLVAAASPDPQTRTFSGTQVSQKIRSPKHTYCTIT